jgi:phospholipid-transporting ATPase
LSFYNLLFTVLPPFVISIFDQFISARLLDRYPQLYVGADKRVLYPDSVLVMDYALYHSLVCRSFCLTGAITYTCVEVLYGFFIILF